MGRFLSLPNIRCFHGHSGTPTSHDVDQCRRQLNTRISNVFKYRLFPKLYANLPFRGQTNQRPRLYPTSAVIAIILHSHLVETHPTLPHPAFTAGFHPWFGKCSHSRSLDELFRPGNPPARCQLGKNAVGWSELYFHVAVHGRISCIVFNLFYLGIVFMRGEPSRANICKRDSLMTNIPLLTVNNLSLRAATGDTPYILKDVHFTVSEGEIVGLMGASGSGKTMTALSIAGLLAPEIHCESGEILFSGIDLLKENPEARRQRLGKDMSMIFQEPLSALNPTMTIERQLREGAYAHRQTITDHDLTEVLKDVGFSNPEKILNSYPHELSGGQRQRILLAGAILPRPRLLIADEATTALDTITQQSFISLLLSLREKYRPGILFITHNQLLANTLCDRIVYLSENHRESTTQDKSFLYFSQRPTKDPIPSETAPLLTLEHVDIGYPDRKSSLLSRLFPHRQRKSEPILHNISFTLHKGEIMGLVGLSGGGKTTLARSISGLLPPYSGKIYHNDRLFTTAHHGKSTPARPHDKTREPYAGMVFQDPYQSLHPYKKIGKILEEALRNPSFQRANLSTAKARTECISETLHEVGLDAAIRNRYPHQLSGGQRQRVSFALNLIASPSLLIADEPLSAVDLPIQIQLIELLEKLHEKRNFGVLFISHDLQVVKALCHSVLIVSDGTIVEHGSVHQVFTHPQHQIVKDLLRAGEYNTDKYFKTK